MHFVATKALLATTVVKERFCGPYVPLFMKGRAMEDIKYTISCKPDGKDDVLFEIDCKKFVRNIEITRQMKDGVESVSISTINAKGAWEDMGKSADFRYGHLIELC